MSLPKRQIHLDFHTSEHIENIGGEFSKEQFQESLKLGHINSITLFSKCHHGWAYHPSKANEIHPNLHFDLLGAQIEAAHEIGVRTPVYLSAGIDEKMSRRHPEWLRRNKDESLSYNGYGFSVPGFHLMCMNTPYLDYLLEQIKEVVKNYDCAEIFLDIVGVNPCYCQYCIKDRLDMGVDPYDENETEKFAKKVYENYVISVREAIDSVQPGLAVFHNCGNNEFGNRAKYRMSNHMEIESLPTGGWGYDVFPMKAAYVRTIGMEYVGMTGKFHGSWGEFGGFKHPNALRYEAALSAALGAGCSVGDQCHPNGKMDYATYNLIGKAYKEYEECEPWLDDVDFVTDVAMLSSESLRIYLELKGKNVNDLSDTESIDYERNVNSDVGCNRMLLEGKYLYNIIDMEEDFNKYKVIILPDNLFLDEEAVDKLKGFIKKGGKILASGRSGISNNKFSFDFGAEYIGKNEYKPDYFVPEFEMKDLDKSAYVMYTQGHKIKLKDGNEYGYRENPYFNRSVFKFSSHKHTPNDCKNAGASIVEGKDGIYIAWNIFEDYATTGGIILKEMFKFAMDKLLGDNKTLVTNLPAQGVTTLTKQKNKNRYVSHILYASPAKRGKKTEVIEDLITICDTKMQFIVSENIKKVYLAPQMQEITFEQKDNRVSLTVDKFSCHQMIVLEY